MRQQRTAVRVVRADGRGWRIDLEGAEVAGTVYGRKDEATRAARQIAREMKGTVVIYDRNGRVQEVASYDGKHNRI